MKAIVKGVVGLPAATDEENTMKLLHIDSSVLSDNSVSRQLTRNVVDQWKQRYPNLKVTYRDLAKQAPSHLSAEILGAAHVPLDQQTLSQRAELKLSEELLEEFLAADVLILGAPMYNFSIPSQLKAWLDRVLVAGRTFKYTTTGPVGLVDGKRAVIVSSRGGIYSEGPVHTMDHQESYLKTALGFVGIRDVTIIRTEGVNISREKREQAITRAQQQVQNLLKAAA